MASYHQRAIVHYNRKARPCAFKIGTLVLRKVFENTVEKGVGKLQTNWEGPYIVSKARDSGAYHLQMLDGTPLLRTWNVSNLKQYYHYIQLKEDSIGDTSKKRNNYALIEFVHYKDMSRYNNK